MSSTIGQTLKLTLFGQSHSEAVGAVLEGFPAGFRPDADALAAFMARRAPGGALATARKEPDEVHFLSGITDGHTCGAPLCLTIANTNVRSADYAAIADLPRPSHADYPAHLRYGGHQDVRGGGHFSARLTAPLCAAGALCLQLLEQYGISVGAHLLSVADVSDEPFDAVGIDAAQLAALQTADFPTLLAQAGERMRSAIRAAAEAGDSVGGIIEAAAVGFPAGHGEPIFDGLENRLAATLFGIPAVKGVEFGDGFSCAASTGSRNNDPWYYGADGTVRTRTNHSGGMLGGLSTGMPLLMRVALKPTPSIFLQQDSISLSRGENAPLLIKGRHDPCVAVRAVPVVTAAVALTLTDVLLTDGTIPRVL
ncbi:MAG: chorismate synthase [Clostridia bacterium]|nr:chorismate synthase [Clostridia bacterium]